MASALISRTCERQSTLRWGAGLLPGLRVPLIGLSPCQQPFRWTRAQPFRVCVSAKLGWVSGENPDLGDAPSTRYICPGGGAAHGVARGGRDPGDQGCRPPRRCVTTAWCCAVTSGRCTSAGGTRNSSTWPTAPRPRCCACGTDAYGRKLGIILLLFSPSLGAITQFCQFYFQNISGNIFFPFISIMTALVLV